VEQNRVPSDAEQSRILSIHADNFASSGALNAKQRELAELQALAQRRLRGTKANLADGFKAAKEVSQDLRWTQKRVR
jgi:Uncharacterized conserved protein